VYGSLSTLDKIWLGAFTVFVVIGIFDALSVGNFIYVGILLGISYLVRLVARFVYFMEMNLFGEGEVEDGGGVGQS